MRNQPIVTSAVRYLGPILFVLALALAPVGTLFAAPMAQAGPSIAITAPESVAVGDTFTATVRVFPDADPVDGVDVFVQYDTNVLEFVSGENVSSLDTFFPAGTPPGGAVGTIAFGSGTLGAGESQPFDLLVLTFNAVGESSGTLLDIVPPTLINGNPPASSTDATVVVAAPVDNCSPISPLPCGDVPVSLPFTLDWSADEGDILDGDGQGTGFTMVDPPSARLASDDPVSNPDVPGYEPSKLDVDTTNGVLKITSTKGIQFSQPSGTPTSTETNSQINALGVGYDASTLPVRIQTTIVNPNFGSSNGNNSQQAGLYFGLNEDEYVKLVVAKTNTTTAKVQLFLEDIPNYNTAFPELNTADNAITNPAAQTVTLIMEIDPSDGSVQGFYSLNGGPEILVEKSGTQSLTLPAKFFAGVDHDSDGSTGAISYAGIFTTQRRAAANQSITFTFDDFSIVSNAPNQSPVAVDDTASTDEDTASAPIVVLANDTDSDGTLDATSVTIVGAPSNGTATANADGTITYTPSVNYNGPDSFTYTVDDNEGATSNAATVSVTVNDVNDAPVANDDAATTDEDTASGPIAVLTNDNDDADADGTLDATSVAVVSAPSNGTATVNPDGTITYTPNADYSGGDSFTYTVNDNDGATSNEATVTVTVNPVNDAPVAVDDSYGTPEETALTVDAPGVLTNDSDVEGDPLTAILDSNVSNGTLTLNANGSFSYTPDAGFSGADSFTYVANDGTVDSATATVTITVDDVNNDPEADDQDVQTDEDIQLPIILTASDSDVGDTLTFMVTAQPTNGTLSGDAPNLTYTPTANFFGSDSFTFQVDDGNGGTDTGTVSITVNPVNDAPVAADDSYGTNEATLLTVAAPGVLTNDSDVEGDPLTAVLDSNVSNGTLTLNSDGSFTYTPDAGFSGTDSFTYTTSDGTVDSAPATVTIAVNDVNDAPVANDQNETTDEDTSLNLTLTASDPDNDPLTYTVVDGPSNGTLSGNAPNLTYVPTANFNGMDSFTFQANDGEFDSNIATVTITVNDINDAPVADDDSATTDEETAVIINVLDGDSDIDGTLDPTSVAVVSAPTSGTATANPDGTITYTPNAGFSGGDSFTYTVNDDDGAISNEATVSVTVQADDGVVLCINAGGAVYTSPTTGRTFVASQSLSGGRAFPVPPAGPKNVAIANTDDDLIYQTDYSSGTDAQGFTAEIPLDNGVYDLELYFAEIYFGSSVNPKGPGGAGKRVFGYSVEGGQASLSGYDIFASVGADAAEVMSYEGIAVTDGGLNINFTVSVNQPKISALCVLESDMVNTDATLNGTLTLEGRSDQSATLAVNLYTPGQGAPAYSFAPTSDASGAFSISGIPAGTYEVAVKQNNHLQVVQTLTLVTGENSAAFGELPAGDANNDNFVTAPDFSLLANSFNKQPGDSGYDARADFNGDNRVTAADFSLLAGNFNTAGQTAAGNAAAANVQEGTEESATDESSGSVALSLAAEGASVSSGELVEIVLVAETGEQPIDTASAFFSFDPALLQVESVTLSDAFDTELASEVDNATGSVRYEAGKLGGPFPSGNVELARVSVRAIGSNGSAATLSLDDASKVYAVGENVLGTTSDVRIEIGEGSAPEQPSGFRLFLPLTQR